MVSFADTLANSDEYLPAAPADRATTDKRARVLPKVDSPNTHGATPKLELTT